MAKAKVTIAQQPAGPIAGTRARAIAASIGVDPAQVDALLAKGTNGSVCALKLDELALGALTPDEIEQYRSDAQRAYGPLWRNAALPDTLRSYYSRLNACWLATGEFSLVPGAKSSAAALNPRPASQAGAGAALAPKAPTSAAANGPVTGGSAAAIFDAAIARFIAAEPFAEDLTGASAALAGAIAKTKAAGKGRKWRPTEKQDRLIQLVKKAFPDDPKGAAAEYASMRADGLLPTWHRWTSGADAPKAPAKPRSETPIDAAKTKEGTPATLA